MRKSKEFVHEGKYAAEVAVDLIEDDTAWSPYLSPDDARRFDTVRLALPPWRYCRGRQIRSRVRNDACCGKVVVGERPALGAVRPLFSQARYC
jgi:hypothetical protein